MKVHTFSLVYIENFSCHANTRLSVIFVLRTWAAWDRSRNMGIFLGLTFVGVWATTFTFAGLSTSTPQSTLFCFSSMWPGSLNFVHLDISVWFNIGFRQNGPEMVRCNVLLLGSAWGIYGCSLVSSFYTSKLIYINPKA